MFDADEVHAELIEGEDRIVIQACDEAGNSLSLAISLLQLADLLGDVAGCLRIGDQGAISPLWNPLERCVVLRSETTPKESRKKGDGTMYQPDPPPEVPVPKPPPEVPAPKPPPEVAGS